jgi:hypothetical protein
MSVKNPFDQAYAPKLSSELLQAVARVKEQVGGAKKIDPETRKVLVMEVFDSLRRRMLQAGAEYITDINQLIKQADGRYIVRRENPERLLELIEDHKALELKTDPLVSDLYANSVIGSKGDGANGLEVAFQEGKGDVAGLAMLAGYRPNHLKIQTVPNSQRPGQGIDRSLVRCSIGTIYPEDVRFVITRVAAQFFPEEELTYPEQERIEYARTPEEGKRVAIFRAFILPESQQKPGPDLAA